MLKYILLLPLFLLITFGFSQTRTGNIKGKILDKTDQRPFVGTTAYIESLQMGSVTDSTGLFVIADVPEGVYSVKISFIGYQEKTIDDILVVPGKTSFFETSIAEAPTMLKDIEIKTFRYENDLQSPVSSFSFSREEIFRNPGAAGDIFRAIGMLPGVQSSGGEFSAIAVRGQGTTDNVYMVDDIPLNEVGHLEGSDNGFNDPQGGRFSIFSPRVIQNANFQAGGFSAQYGRKSSAYLGLEIKEGSKENYSADAQFDLLGFTVNAEGPLGRNTGVFASARYQNFKPVLKLIKQEKEGYPAYSDFLIKTSSELGRNNKLSIIAMYNPEVFTRDVSHVLKDEKLQDDFLADTRQDKGLIGANLKTLVGSRSVLKTIAYYRFKSAEYNYGRAFVDFKADGSLPNQSEVGTEKKILYQQQDESELGSRLIFNHQLNDNSQIIAGLDFSFPQINYERRLSRPDTSYVFGKDDFRQNATNQYIIISPQLVNATYKQHALNNSLYAEYSIRLFKRLNLNFGERYDRNGFTMDKTVSHRLSGSYLINEKNSVNFSTGVFYNDPIYPDIADQSALNRLASERVMQLITGYKLFFTPDLKLTVEGYYKKFNDQVIRPDRGNKQLANQGSGTAYGVDLSLIKRLSKKYFGQVSYSYMQSKRNDSDGLGDYDFLFSQPHILNVLASYKPNVRWVLSGKFRYATGRPTNSYTIHSNIFNDPLFIRYSQEVVGKNEDRLNDFVSADVRVDYRKQFEHFGFVCFLDIANLLDRKNANYNEFFERTGKVAPAGLGVLPSLGIRIEF